MYEFAITIPILIFLFAGGYEVARALWQYELVNKGVRDAARYLARVDDPTSANSKTVANNLVLRGSIDTSLPLRIYPGNVNVRVGTLTFDNSGGTYRGPDGGTADVPVVHVQADVTFDATLLGFLGIETPLTFTVAHEQRYIGD